MEPPFFGSSSGGGGGNPGDEALRWLTIAEKLLTARDLMGSKSFATRAREADPQLIPAYQILAVVDTLIASEKRINNQLDWYLILQLPPTHDSDLIATQYRRLAILLNPQKTQLPFADQAFRLVVEAWSVLSNPSRKRSYDAEVSLHLQTPVNPLVTLNLSGQSLVGQDNPPLQQQQPQPRQEEFLFQINSTNNNSNNNNNSNSNPIMRGFREELRGGNVMGNFSGQMHVPRGEVRGGISGNYTSQNVRGSGEEERGRNVGGNTSSGVRGLREEERAGSIRSDTSNNNVRSVREEERGKNVADFTRVSVRLPDEEERGGTAGGINSTNELVEEEEDEEEEREQNETVNDVEGTFWTACPYCFHMFEYPKVYVDCTLRCQKCRKAFHGVEVASPPPIVEGEAYFCCWGYMPLAVSVGDLRNDGAGDSNWTPFSPMFTCPQKPGNLSGRKSSGGPRFYHDDDDVYVEVSDSSEGSDDDWQKSEKRKKTKNVKGKRASAVTPGKSAKKRQVEKATSVIGSHSKNTQGGFVIQESDGGMVNVVIAESKTKGPASNTRRQTGRAAKDFGKLDLNVEFSNEVEEQAPRTSQANGAGHGNEDNFEGTAFFEGLDEFLSSLPILSGVGDDRVKAA